MKDAVVNKNGEKSGTPLVTPVLYGITTQAHIIAV